MSFRAQFGPDDVREIHANRSDVLATPRHPDRLDFYVSLDLDASTGVTLAGTREDLPAMRALLRGMLDALDALDPDQGDQVRVTVGDRYDSDVIPPWHPTLNRPAEPETPATDDGTEAEGGEAA